MVNRHFKKILVLSLLSIAFNTSANTTDKDLLVQQCRDLSENIISLVSSQGKKTCMEKLADASAQIETAGEFIMDESNSSARQELDSAIFSLQYAELNNCNRYIQISHSKFAAQKIKSSLGQCVH